MLNSINHAAKPVSFGTFRVIAPDLSLNRIIQIIPTNEKTPLAVPDMADELRALDAEVQLAEIIRAGLKSKGVTDVTIEPDMYKEIPGLERNIEKIKRFHTGE